MFLGGDERNVELLKEVFLLKDGVTLDMLSRMEEDEFEINRIKHLALYTVTCYMIAAKYDELDENIPLI